MNDEEMVDYLARCLVDPGSAPVDRDAAARLPAGGARRPRPRRRDLRARERARPAGRRARRARRGHRGRRLPAAGIRARGAVADSPRARAVVLAHHGLVTWGETHEQSYGLTLELVERARAYLGAAGRSPIAAAARAPRPSSSCPAARAALARGGARCSRSRLRSARSPTETTSRGLAAMRGTPDHMLRIGSSSCVVELDGRRRGGGALRGRLRRLSRAPGRSRRPRCSTPHRASCSCPGSACIAAARIRARAHAARDRRAHSTRAVAATLDRFGTRELARRAGALRFEYWPLELYKLSLAPPPPELAGRIVIVTGAASGIGREIAPTWRPRRGARARRLDAEGLEETAAGIEGAVRVVGDLTERRGRRRARRARRSASFGGLDAVVFNAGIASTGQARRRSTSASGARSLEINLTAHFLLTRACGRCSRRRGSVEASSTSRRRTPSRPAPASAPTRSRRPGSSSSRGSPRSRAAPVGIRANAVNPDAIFTGSRLWSDEVRAERAERARRRTRRARALLRLAEPARPTRSAGATSPRRLPSWSPIARARPPAPSSRSTVASPAHSPLRLGSLPAGAPSRGGERATLRERWRRTPARATSDGWARSPRSRSVTASAS